MARAALPFDDEETESERAEASSSDSDCSDVAHVPARDDDDSESDSEGGDSDGVTRDARPAKDDESSDESGLEDESSDDSEEEDESGDESEQEGGEERGGARIKAEPGAESDDSDSESDGSESEYEEEDDDEDAGRVEKSKGKQGRQRVESSDDDDQEEVRDDVMFKEEEPDAAAVDDDRDSDYKEEDDGDGEEEEAEEEMEEELEKDDEEDPDDDGGGGEGGGGQRPRYRSMFYPERRFDPRRKGRDMRRRERDEVVTVLQHLRSFTSNQERNVITKGYRVTGPPIHEPLTPLERLARKFRWPRHLRNVRNTNFTQDPVEIIEDHEVSVTASRALQHESGSYGRDMSAFAAPPRPLMVSAANALRHASRKRKRESNGDGDSTNHEDGASSTLTPQEQTVSGDAFVSLARAGSVFSDRYMESLLKANLTELQGTGEHDACSQRCWTPLPVSRKPVANWRFVFEHLLMNRDARFGEPNDAFWPRMNDSTLQRIRDRLKSLYRATWQPADDKLFDLMTREGRQLDDIVDDGGAESDQDTSTVEP